MSKLIVILGPTASGKTDLSIKLARKFKGEIVSADSRQIYKGMDIGTGKATKQEMSNIPHHLIDITAPTKPFSVKQYQTMAIKKIKSIDIPFLVGGSAFYIYSIVQGWVFPNIQANNKLRQELQAKSKDQLISMLRKLDKKRLETIDKHNKRRLIRAIEIATQLGTVPELKNNPEFECLILGINKQDLKQRIGKRVDEMFKQGLEQEARQLKDKYGFDLSPMQTIGYQEWEPYFNGDITREEVKQNIISSTVSFSKRQMTWFKRDKRIHWINNQKQAQSLIKKFI